MPITKTGYCHHCHKAPSALDDSAGKKIQAKGINFASKVSSEAHIAKNMIKAHPVASGLIAIALATSLVAAIVLFATGLALPGMAVAEVGLMILVLGAGLFYYYRRQVRAEDFKKAHSFEKMQDRIQNRKVCLVIEGAFDDNGAVKYRKGPSKIEKQYPLVHYRVKNLQEMQKAIKEVSQHAEIQVLFINAHGCQNGIALGGNAGEAAIVLNAVDPLKDTFDLIQEDATIVLGSCEAAKKTPQQMDNIAKQISVAAKGRRVLGSSVKVEDSDIRFKRKGALHVEMRTSRFGSKAANPGDKIKNYGCRYVRKFTPSFISKHLEKNAMRVYVDGKLQNNSARVAV